MVSVMLATFVILAVIFLATCFVVPPPDNTLSIICLFSSIAVLFGIIIGSISMDHDNKMTLINKKLGSYEVNQYEEIIYNKFRYIDISKYELKQGENDE